MNATVRALVIVGFANEQQFKIRPVTALRIQDRHAEHNVGGHSEIPRMQALGGLLNPSLALERPSLDGRHL
jgi:hypothetical protein